MATEIKLTDGAVALVVTAAGTSEPTAQLTVFTDDSYPSGVLSVGGMENIVEVDLGVFNQFATLVWTKCRSRTWATCRCMKTGPFRSHDS